MPVWRGWSSTCRRPRPTKCCRFWTAVRVCCKGKAPAQWEPLVKPMRLTLAYHPVTDVRFGATTQLRGTTLEISEAALCQHLLEDRRLERVDLAIVHPGEACRFGVVFD